MYVGVSWGSGRDKIKSQLQQPVRIPPCRLSTQLQVLPLVVQICVPIVHGVRRDKFLLCMTIPYNVSILQHKVWRINDLVPNVGTASAYV